MENKERSISFYAGIITDHTTNWVHLQRVLINENMPVTWHGPEPELLRSHDGIRLIMSQEVFPEGELDADLQQQLISRNHKRLRLGQIETTEMRLKCSW
jgi:hypothetical protein